jgi:hypothetical protein
MEAKMGTKIIEYKDIKAAERDISWNARKGWEVDSIQVAGGQKQKVGKSVGIGVATSVVFTPLAGIIAGALFGKSRDKRVTVIYTTPGPVGWVDRLNEWTKEQKEKNA